MTEILVVCVLLALGYGFGTRAESRHYASIRRREEAFGPVMIFAARFPPDPERPRDSRLVSGQVVISVDYFQMT